MIEGSCTRPYCSGSTPSMDEYGVWALTRAEGNYDEYSAAEMDSREEEWFGEAFEFDEGLGRYCVDDYTFGTDGPWADSYEESPTGTSWIDEGVPCTNDEDLWRRYQNSLVTPSGNLPADPADWPRNVMVANEALSAEALETMLAGVGYDDEADRESFATVWQWFPALCGEKPADSDLTYMDVCRWEFVAVALMALAGETEEAEYIARKETDMAALEGAEYYEEAGWQDDFAELDWYQTTFVTISQEPDCLYGEWNDFYGDDGSVDTTLQDACRYGADGWVETAGTWEDATQYYYERGFGILGLRGSEEYSEFSKAIFGNEWELVEYPNMLWEYSGGDGFQILPVAVLIWRYLARYHSGLPSPHDVVTGFWEPTEAEEEAGLQGPHDFCTLVTAVGSVWLMREYGPEIIDDSTGELNAQGWNSAAASTIPAVADGSLGWAAYQMTQAFGLEVPEDYDVTCMDVMAWPEPEVDSYDPLYVDISGGDFVGVPWHTNYNMFVEGDVKRAFMDLTDPSTDLKARRGDKLFDGLVCIYWDNWDGWNPQPWADGDCGLQALFLNDYYYECYYDDSLYYCDYLGNYDYDGDGCLIYDYETYECLEYECYSYEGYDSTTYEYTTYYDDDGYGYYKCMDYYSYEDMCDDFNDTTGECDCYDYYYYGDGSELNECYDLPCYSAVYDEDGDCMDWYECDFWYEDGICVCPGTVESDGSCNVTACNTYYDEYDGSCKICPMDYYDDTGACVTTALCDSGSGIWYYDYDYEGYSCYCAGFWEMDETTGFPTACNDCPNGEFDTNGDCIDALSDCDTYWEYDDYSYEYYCYEYICWTETYDSDGYCLDLCYYGYDAETLECYEEFEWDMFSESPYMCLDAFWCANTPPGSDDDVWEAITNDDGFPEQDFRIGFFESQGEMYAPCMDWDRYITDFNKIRLYDGQYYDLLTSTTNVEFQPITYLCFEGLAIQCAMDPSTGFYQNADYSGLACIDAGDPAEVGLDMWEL